MRKVKTHGKVMLGKGKRVILGGELIKWDAVKASNIQGMVGREGW